MYKISVDGIASIFVGTLYLACISIATFSYALVAWFKFRCAHSYLRGGYAKYALFIGFMAVLSSILFITIFLSTRQGLKLDPPGGDSIFIFTLIGFFIVTVTTFNWVNEKALFIISTLSIAIITIIALMVNCWVYQVISIADYCTPGLVIFGYALLIKIHTKSVFKSNG